MAIEKVGYCRLYDSIGCSLSNEEELEFKIDIGDVQSIVYIGPQPKRGIVIASNIGKYVVPSEISSVGEWKIYKDANDSGYPRNFFTEIQCIKSIEVSEELSKEFQNKKNEAQNEIVDLAEKESPNFKRVADLIAGIIGLRFHRQFVLEIINERFFAIRNEPDWVHRISGPWLERLEELSLNENGVTALANTLESAQKAPDDAQKFGSSIFFWLLRAWTERDSISKFMALFIPLTIVLGKIGKDDLEDDKEKYFEEIRQLIVNSEKEDQKRLLMFIDQLEKSQQPSLVTRFEVLARVAKLSGYEADIIAFKKFNRIRNFLLHRGDPSIKLTVSVGEEETQQLEDLVERYVSWFLYRDSIVYPSSWRQKRLPNK